MLPGGRLALHGSCALVAGTGEDCATTKAEHADHVADAGGVFGRYSVFVVGVTLREDRYMEALNLVVPAGTDNTRHMARCYPVRRLDSADLA